MKTDEASPVPASPLPTNPMPAKERWKIPLLSFVILALLAGGATLYLRRDPAPQAALPPPPVPVIATAVSQRDVQIYLTGLGTVTALNTATIRSQITGQLTSINFVEGQFVKKGDLLAQIDPRTYQAQVDQAEAALSRDQAHLANAQVNLGRYSPLLNKGYASDLQVADQRSQVSQLSDDLKSDLAAIDNAKAVLSYTSLLAPFDGITGIRLIDVGNIVHPSDASGVVVVTQIQPISVIFTLPTVNLQQVQDALAIGPLKTIAFSQDDKTLVDTGQLLLVDNEANPNSGTVRLKAIFPNPQRRLWPGAFVNVRLITATQHNGLTVPLDALQQGPQGEYVFVVGKDQKVTMRPVAVRQTSDGEALIDKGLKVGETVVVRGQYRLVPGTVVSLADPNNPGAVPNPSTASSGMLP
ncbi:MAG: efflux RND transporter periplasmic adaptor subunit [Dongiaceae bacterium]